MSAERIPRPASNAELYRAMALSAMPRLLGSLDREPWSPTSGSFDRDHWGWHFRDFPIGMLQAGIVPLAVAWSARWPDNPYAGSTRLREWILAALEATLRRQHRNGSFDSVGPFTQDHGVTLQMANAIAMTLRCLGDAAPADLSARAREAVHRASRFASRSDEDYAFISNHRALFALAWLRAGALLDDDSLRQRADRELQAVLDHQSREGWHAEYGGADPGYQSLCMAWLAQFQAERPSEALAASLRRAVEFIAHTVHPDGGVGGVYGSRLTSLWFPSGFEQLAGEDPLAAAVADAVTEGIASGAVVTPESTDIHNLPPLLHSYLVAAEAAGGRAQSNGTTSLPREALAGTRYFDEAGLVVSGSPRYYAVMNLRRGGVGYVFARATRRMAWEDAGYVARCGDQAWTSALDAAEVTTEADGSFTIQARLGEAKREVLTPARFVLLRLANLTLFRIVAVGAVLRRMIIARLITSRRAGHFLFSRRMQFTPDDIEIRDRLHRESGPRADAIVRARAFTPFHMGSSRYFHPRDLVESAGSGRPLDSRQLNDGSLDLLTRIRIHPDGAVDVREEPAPSP